MSMPTEVGTFCWYSIQTTNVDVTGSFYMKAFGWTQESFNLPGTAKPMHVFGAGTGLFCDIGPIQTPKAPSHWMPYLAVTNLTNTLKTIETFGGQVVKSQFDLPTIGKTAVVTDPAGTYFMAFQPERQDQTISVMANKPNHVCWNELMLTNVKSVIPFYENVFQWSIEQTQLGNQEYYVANYGGKGKGPEFLVAGLMEKPKDMPTTQPMWQSMIQVTSVSKSLGTCSALGAKILTDITNIPQGKFALLASPTAETFFIFEPSDKN